MPGGHVTRSRSLLISTLLVLSAGCSDGGATDGGGGPDASVIAGDAIAAADATALDATAPDAFSEDGTIAPDAAAEDAIARDAVAEDAVAQDSGAADAGPTDLGPAPPYLTELTSPLDFLRLQGSRDHVKYLATVRGATTTPPLVEDCYFQNMDLFPYHIDFLHSFSQTSTLSTQRYGELVLRRPTRIWWGGGLMLFRRVHPISGASPVLGYTIYTESVGESAIRESDVLEVDALLKSCAPYADQILAFYPSDNFQRTFAQRSMASLMAQGVGVLLGP